MERRVTMKRQQNGATFGIIRRKTEKERRGER